MCRITGSLNMQGSRPAAEGKGADMKIRHKLWLEKNGRAYTVFLAVARLLYGAHWAAQGVFTLFAVLFVFVGMQFFAFGILGEYINRIYREVRKRPEYVIEKVHSSDTSGDAS